MTQGTFLVTAADDDSAVLRDVDAGQVHTLADNPDLEAGEVLAGTLEPEPPLAVTWRVAEIDERRTVVVEAVDEPPTRQARDLAPEEVGDVAITERAGEGEVHVLTVPPAETASAVGDVLDDEATLARAARLGVGRVEVRAADGVLAVRYLP